MLTEISHKYFYDKNNLLDIDSLSHLKLFQSLGLCGIMLGRVACLNPKVFYHFREYLEKKQENTATISDLTPWTKEIMEEVTKDYLNCWDRYCIQEYLFINFD